MDELKRVKELAGIQTLTEEKAEYEDSADFTEELSDVEEMTKKLFDIVGSKRWSNWMKITDTNYSTHCVQINKRLVDNVTKVKNCIEQLMDDLDDAQ
jgi:Sec7-like guanine-nucleotide exchange factor